MKNILLTIGFLFVITTFAQTECSLYHKKKYCYDGEGMFMKYDGQSKSAIMAKGQKSEFHLVAYNGQDYRVSICNESNLGNEVRFKIYEKQKVLVKPKVEEVVEETDESSDEDYSEDDYSEDYDDYSDDAYEEDEPAAKVNKGPQFKLVKELLYDNSQDGYAKSIEFTAEGSMSLIVEVTVPGAESKMKLKVRETGCVGVLIQRTKSQNTGFR